jgi:hypothetical protein
MMPGTIEFLPRGTIMKNKYACLIAGMFLFIMLATSATNYIYVNNTFDIINTELSSLPVDLTICASKIPELKNIWEERRIFLNLTHPKPALDKVSELFEDAIIAASHENINDFETTMAHLRRAIANIRDLEGISINNIF